MLGSRVRAPEGVQSKRLIINDYRSFCFLCVCLSREGLVPVIRSGRSRTATDTKKGKLLISHRYNRIPLLNSLPGGFYRSWSYKTYPNAKVTLFSESANILRKIRRKKGGKTFAQMFPSRTTDRIPTRCRAPVPHAPPAACRATFGYACCGPTGAVQAEAFALGLHDFAGTSPAQIGGASAKCKQVCFCSRLARLCGDKPPLR